MVLLSLRSIGISSCMSKACKQNRTSVRFLLQSCFHWRKEMRENLSNTKWFEWSFNFHFETTLFYVWFLWAFVSIWVHNSLQYVTDKMCHFYPEYFMNQLLVIMLPGCHYFCLSEDPPYIMCCVWMSCIRFQSVKIMNLKNSFKAKGLNEVHDWIVFRACRLYSYQHFLH